MCIRDRSTGTQAGQLRSAKLVTPGQSTASSAHSLSVRLHIPAPHQGHRRHFEYACPAWIPPSISPLHRGGIRSHLSGSPAVYENGIGRFGTRQRRLTPPHPTRPLPRSVYTLFWWKLSVGAVRGFFPFSPRTVQPEFFERFQSSALQRERRKL